MCYFSLQKGSKNNSPATMSVFCHTSQDCLSLLYTCLCETIHRHIYVFVRLSPKKTDDLIILQPCENSAQLAVVYRGYIELGIAGI